MPLHALQQLPIDPHMIDFGIGLAAQFCYDRAVHLNVPGRDQLLGLPPRSNTRRRNDFLEPFKWHIGTFVKLRTVSAEDISDSRPLGVSTENKPKEPRAPRVTTRAARHR